MKKKRKYRNGGSNYLYLQMRPSGVGARARTLANGGLTTGAAANIAAA
jgi:hypothetical protein